MSCTYQDNHRILEKLVNREVMCNMSMIVSDLQKIYHQLDHKTQRDLSFEEDDLNTISEKIPKPEDVAFEQGWRVTQYEGEWYWHNYKDEVFTKNFPKGWGVEKKVSDDGVDCWVTIMDEGEFDTEEEAIAAEWKNYLPDVGHDYEEDAWEACVEDERIDVYEHAEPIYEHWAVTNWFADKLREHGESVAELGGLSVWGRGTTGQSISCDGVILRIAESMEICKGQKYEWTD